jgi:hypothetical protein
MKSVIVHIISMIGFSLFLIDFDSLLPQPETIYFKTKSFKTIENKNAGHLFHKHTFFTRFYKNCGIFSFKTMKLKNK